MSEAGVGARRAPSVHCWLTPARQERSVLGLVGLGLATQPRGPGAAPTVLRESRLGAWAFAAPPAAAVSGAVMDPLQKAAPQPSAPLMHAGSPVRQAPGLGRGQARRSEGQTWWQAPTGSSSTCPAHAATLSPRSGLIKDTSVCVQGTLPGRAEAGCLL